MPPAPDRTRASADDPELSRLIRAERVRMLFASTVPVAVASAVTAIALALLVAPQVGSDRAALWAALCIAISIARVIHLGSYNGSAHRASGYWLKSLTVLCGVHGAIWGLAGLLMPVHDLVTTAVIVATLLGACAVCTFTLQAHMHPNLATNLPMLLPAVVMLLSRKDMYGLYGGFGLLTLLGLMMFESRRVERRTTELLWLRFTTDRIARERAEALKLAQRHSAVKDQFLATMSHEMRTPLHGILGLARLVHGRLPARAGLLNESRHQVELIERTGEHLLGIINDVLDFSRIEAGKLQIHPSDFDLHTAIHDVLSLLSVTASEKGLKLETHLDTLAVPCWVKGDAARVRQVLHNLIGNAIKFTDRGSVDVRVQRDPQAPDEVVFRIEDTGVGIPPHHLPLVFEAFHQVDGTFGRKHKGTGLGLTISREIARAMEGDITCASTMDKGSTFTFRLPLRAVPIADVDLALPLGEAPGDCELPAGIVVDAAPAQVPDTMAAQAGSPPQLKAVARRHGKVGHILLAEDNAVNALVAEATLANLGVTVTRVENGQQALAELQRDDHPYDMVLMDCQMPVLDGIEATRRLRVWESERGRKPLPVVALTANAMTTDRDRCMSVGMNEHLPKPFKQSELEAALLRHLPSLATRIPAKASA